MGETGESELNTTKDFVVKIGEVRYIPVYEPKIPRKITDQILVKEKIPTVPKLGSSMIEDFIVERMKEGGTSNEGIVEAFFSEDMPNAVGSFVQEVQDVSSKMDWDGVFNERDISETQTAVLLEMREMGMTEEQVARIAEMKPKVAEGIGISSLNEDVAYASRLQAVRRGMDYLRVFGNESSVEEVVRAFLTSTIAHELGHKVDEVADRATNRIENEWKNKGEFVDNKLERFAEYWGQVPFKNDEKSQKIIEREWLIQLHKTTEVWDVLEKYNNSHDEKIDLFAVFRGIEERLDKEGDVGILALLNARRTVYRGSPVENYASPYSRDVVEKAIKQ